jgi:hypothetical protein
MRLLSVAVLSLFAAAACQSQSEPPSRSDSTQTAPDAGLPPPPPPPPPPPAPDPHRVGGLGAGPWPTAPITVYGSAQGLFEAPISASTDEAENIWVVTDRALYLLAPGDKNFRRFTAADGLHVGPGWTEPPDFTLVVGGSAGECFVGYYAHDTHDPPDPNAHTYLDPVAHLGKMDQVKLNPDGTLQVNRYDFHNSNDWRYYETRTITSAYYDHFSHPGELYVGSNHGVTRVQPAKFRQPSTSAEKADPWSVEKEYYADHVHPWTCDVGTCTGSPTDHIVFGDFYALTMGDDGRVWMGGLTAAAAIRWTSDLQFWRNSWEPDNPFDPAMPGKGGPMVFNPPRQGGNINLRAIAVTTDGTAWFASGEVESWRGPTYGLASWRDENPYHMSYTDPTAIGAAEYNVLEMVAWGDKLVLGFPSTGLLVWKPGDARGKRMGFGEGLPGQAIGRMYIDRMVDPPQLLVPTEGGLAVVRALP